MNNAGIIARIEELKAYREAFDCAQLELESANDAYAGAVGDADQEAVATANLIEAQDALTKATADYEAVREELKMLEAKLTDLP